MKNADSFIEQFRNEFSMLSVLEQDRFFDRLSTDYRKLMALGESLSGDDIRSRLFNYFVSVAILIDENRKPKLSDDPHDVEF
jgi:hypothetical protein